MFKKKIYIILLSVLLFISVLNFTLNTNEVRSFLVNANLKAVSGISYVVSSIANVTSFLDMQPKNEELKTANSELYETLSFLSNKNMILLKERNDLAAEMNLAQEDATDLIFAKVEYRSNAS